MVLRQTLDHLLERHDARRRYDARLAQIAADHAAEGAAALDEGRRAAEERADRRRETLGDAEAHAIAVRGDALGADAEGDRGVEEARAVDMHGNALPVRDARDRFHVRKRQHGTARRIVRRLERDERRRQAVRRDAGTDRLLECRQVERPSLGGQCPVEEAGEPGDATHLRARDVALGIEQHFAAAPGMGEEGHEIGHAAARHEDGRLLSRALGGERLERTDRGIAVA